MQLRSTGKSVARTCVHPTLPETRSMEPSAVEAARQPSADVDHSASNTETYCQDRQHCCWGRRPVPAAQGQWCSSRSASPSSSKKSIAPVRICPPTPTLPLPALVESLPAAGSLESSSYDATATMWGGAGCTATQSQLSCEWQEKGSTCSILARSRKPAVSRIKKCMVGRQAEGMWGRGS